MRLIILSTSPGGRVARRLYDVAVRAGISVEIRSLEGARDLRQLPLSGVVLLPRIAPSHNHQAVKLLSELQEKGAHIINAPQTWDISRDKWQSYIAFTKFGVPTPRTLLFSGLRYEDYVAALGAPSIFKPISGTHGEGIKILRQQEDLQAEPGIIQEYIDESVGTDLRVVVVGGRVIAAMKRVAQAGEFRANLHQGATAEKIELDETVGQAAIDACKSLGLDVAGVDIVMSARGPLVLEANPSPGFGIEGYTGISIADAIIQAVQQGAI